MTQPARRASHAGLIFWIGLAVVLIGAAIPRFLTYDYGLPYVEHPDEPNKYLAVQAWRGLYQHPSDEYYRGYPPGYLATAWLVQVAGEPLGVNGLADNVRVLRFLSVVVNLGTLLFIALGARRIAGTGAGWAAGAAWAVSPTVIENGVYAIQDPWVYGWVALATWLAIAALQDERPGLALASIGAGIAAALFKYPAIAAVLPGAIAAIIFTIRDPRRRWWLVAGPGAIGIGLSVWVYRQIQLMTLWQRHAREFAQEGLGGVLSPGRVLGNLYAAFGPINPIPALIVIGLGAAAYLYARQADRRQIDLPALGLALSVLVAIPWLAATFSGGQGGRIKDFLPATTAACLLWGAALSQLTYLLPDEWPAAARIAPPLLAAGLVLGPLVAPAAELVQERRLPDRRVAMRDWFDRNLDPGDVLVTDENERTFNPFWGGLAYAQWITWHRIERAELTTQTPAAWRESENAAYAILPLDMVSELEQTPDGQGYLDQLLPLRTFAAPPPARGPEMTVYRLWPPEHEAAVRFGDAIRLVGYDLNAEALAPGKTLSVRLYWQADQPPADNYSVFLHLTPPGDVQPVTQADGNPAQGTDRLTLTWTDPTETLISPAFALALPADLPPGPYRLLIGLYNYQTGVRLPVTDRGPDTPEGSYLLAAISVQP